MKNVKIYSFNYDTRLLILIQYNFNVSNTEGRLLRLFQIRFWVPKKNPVAADLGQFRVIFFFYIKYGKLWESIRRV